MNDTQVCIVGLAGPSREDAGGPIDQCGKASA